MKNAVEIVLTGIVLCMILLMLVAMPMDIMDFLADKESHAMVHQIDMTQDNWEWDYLIRWVYGGIFIAAGVTIIFLRIVKRKNKIIEIVNWAYVLFVLGIIFFGFYTWMESGFDH